MEGNLKIIGKGVLKNMVRGAKDISFNVTKLDPFPFFHLNA